MVVPEKRATIFFVNTPVTIFFNPLQFFPLCIGQLQRLKQR